MTRTKWLIVGFWAFIGLMLLWQFTDYNAHMDREADAHPVQTQFFFYNTNTAPVNGAGSRVVGPDLKQTAYWTEPDKPSQGMFISHITLKNMGTAKATGIQVWIRPYKGTHLGDEDNGNGGALQKGTLSDNDPLSQYGQWINVPDLAPGESASEQVTFVARRGFNLGDNPSPQVIFATDKAQ